MKPLLLTVCALLPALTPAFAADSALAEHDKRILESAHVLGEIMGADDKAIPRDLLQKAQCVGVVPNLKRAGFIVGAKYGKGVLTCRTENAEGWTAPSTTEMLFTPTPPATPISL